MKKLFILILNHNQAADTISCVESVEKEKITGVKIEVVVIDNGSTDNSVLRIRNRFPKLTFFENYRNVGFAEGVNRGIEYALENKGDYVFLLNNDAVLTGGALRKLVERMRAGRKIGIIGPKIYYMQSKIKRIWFAGGEVDKKRFTAGHVGVQEEDEGQYDKESDTDYITGAAMLIKREVFEKIGLFNSNFFLYYEDADFCLRARADEFRVIYFPKALVYHEVSVFHQEPLFHYYMTRNHLLFLEKHAPIYNKIRELVRMPLTLFEIFNETPAIRKFRFYGVVDFFRRRFGKCERII